MDLGRIKQAHVLIKQHIHVIRKASIHQELNEPVSFYRGNSTKHTDPVAKNEAQGKRFHFSDRSKEVKSFAP